MEDTDCIRFLQRVLPGLHMQWKGFRKVRGQVCKRIQRRINILRLANIAAYGVFLETHPQEWEVLDSLCRVTISRFYRDKQVFTVLQKEIIPDIIHQASHRGEGAIEVWSAGCGAGEEAYTFALLWKLGFLAQYPGLTMHILATDADADLLVRATKACYAYSSIKNLPEQWRETAFTCIEDQYCLRPEYHENVKFICHDIRAPVVDGPFHMILCRNLAFTYFDNALQLETIERLWSALRPGGILVIGVHESLPGTGDGFIPVSRRLGIYRKAQ